MKKILSLIFGHIFLILGIIGAFLPVLPTTPFLLLAAWLYSKSSPRLHNWIINHKVFGPPLRNWQERGVIGMRAKIIATVMLILVIVLRIRTLEVNIYIRGFATVVLIGVLVFIWTRPSEMKK